MTRPTHGQPRAKYGQIKFQYGYSSHEGYDHFRCYGGHPGGSRDSRLLAMCVSERRYSVIDREFGPSILEQLELRGYDITTLKISCEKKDINEQGSTNSSPE